MLVVRDLAVSYGKTPALRGVSLRVDEGELVSVIGPNGAGKSSMLLAIAGAVPTTSGVVSLDGQPLTGGKPEDIVRRGVALVPEGRQIFTTLSVKENLLLGVSNRRDATLHAEMDELLARFPILAERIDSPAGRLSGGQQQQLAIARALLTRPRVLLLDEPSLGLAPTMVGLVFDYLRALREKGMTILLVEQSAALGIEIADRVYVLRQGRVEMTGTRAELLQSERFMSAYFGFGVSGVGVEHTGSRG